MRETKLKKLLRQIMASSATPLSVPDITQALSVLKLTANKTTIYRELASLLDQGLVKELDFGEGKKRYEYSSQDHHHHLICTQCKNIQHIELSEVETVLQTAEKAISSKNRFQVTDHALELFGLCGRCQS